MLQMWRKYQCALGLILSGLLLSASDSGVTGLHDTGVMKVTDLSRDMGCLKPSWRRGSESISRPGDIYLEVRFPDFCH
jgi:hypothetical protein